MIKSRKFIIPDLEHFKPADLDIEPYLNNDLISVHRDPKNTVLSIVDGNETIAFLGILFQRLGAGEVFLIPSDKTKNYIIDFFKVVKGTMEKVCFDILGYHRLEMAVKITEPWADKWARLLGFQFEGIARAYDSSLIDHKVYSRINLWQPEQ